MSRAEELEKKKTQKTKREEEKGDPPSDSCGTRLSKTTMLVGLVRPSRPVSLGPLYDMTVAYY